jgi:hypothetical protein
VDGCILFHYQFLENWRGHQKFWHQLHLLSFLLERFRFYLILWETEEEKIHRKVVGIIGSPLFEVTFIRLIRLRILKPLLSFYSFIIIDSLRRIFFHRIGLQFDVFSIQLVTVPLHSPLGSSIVQIQRSHNQELLLFTLQWRKKKKRTLQYGQVGSFWLWRTKI